MRSPWHRVLGVAVIVALAVASLDGSAERGADTRAQDAGVVVFNGGFDTGVSPPWEGVQACPGAGSRFDRLASPGSDHGGYAARATVRRMCGFGSQRAEVLGAPAYTEGAELYFGHSVRFPSDFPARQHGWCATMQIHTAQRGKLHRPSALSLNCRDAPSDPTLIRAQSNPGCVWRTGMVRGVWLHFVWRVRFSATNGSWDLWYRPDAQGRYAHVVNDCATNALLSPDDVAYWKLGLYRGSANVGAVSVFHDDAKVGTTFEAVAP